MLLSRSSYEDVDKDVLLPNVKMMLSNLICKATKMNLSHRFLWQQFSAGRSIFGQGNSLQSKYYCFGGKEDVIQNNTATKHADKFFLVTYCIVNRKLCVLGYQTWFVLTIRNFSIRLTELKENVKVSKTKAKLEIHESSGKLALTIVSQDQLPEMNKQQ